MIQSEPITIPEKYTEFAKAFADLTELHGITDCQAIIKPHWKDEIDRRTWGELKIHSRQIDGRGRPCRNLCIDFTANHTVNLISTPESSS